MKATSTPEPNNQTSTDLYWVLDALSSLKDASMRYRLGVYGQEELKLYEERAERVLRAWGYCKDPQGANTTNSKRGNDQSRA